MLEISESQKELPRAYEPARVESKLYDFWLEKGLFTPKIDLNKKPFVIIMPPPNVTGELHLGHTLPSTFEDIMTRWHRMLGEPTLLLPGVDHAGIATQVVVEQQLAKEGLKRQDLGRDKFNERTWEWIRKYRQAIADQFKRMGVSCDWTRDRFTLDEGPSRAVRTTFVNLYRKGLIYRGERMINWCPRCGTALSDLETEHRDVTGHLWYVRYLLASGEGESITVATTRPETILGDTAVAVNPNDKRYSKIIGEKAVLPVIGRQIPIIADDVVDMSFGTGAVKVTPGHDPVDFDISQRHNLPVINILNPDATMNENAGPCKGQDRFACRKYLIEHLEKEGMLLKTETHSHSVGHCARCNSIVEPIVSKQWFVKMAPLAKPAIDAVVEKKIEIIPEHFTKTYLNWMENIRDWCISRQLWWGHRIPVWYCQECGHLTVTVDEPKSCAKCQSANIVQDPDVLDTWFSSGLWPHSTLGWPDSTEDFKYFYPTTVMETGYDILFFWVARMIMMGLENTGEIPFRYVYLNGLIRDEKGQKMSKLRKNVLNPLEIIEKYGTDALRFSITTGTSPGNDVNLSTQKLEAGRNFANKLWNSARFILMNLPADTRLDLSFDKNCLPVEDCWILSLLHQTIHNVTKLMNDFQFGEAEKQIHDFIWGDFCDWYIEMAKIRLRQPGEKTSPLPVLVYVMETSLRLLHPFMPFITEELWQNFATHINYKKAKPVAAAVAPYPVIEKEYIDEKAEREMADLIEIVRAVRNVRSEFKIEPSRFIKAVIYTRESSFIAGCREFIKVLARTDPVEIIASTGMETARAKGITLVLKNSAVVLPLTDVLNVDVERKRLESELEHCQKDTGIIEAKLSQKDFVSRAPAQIVEREQQKLQSARDKIDRLKLWLSQIG